MEHLLREACDRIENIPGQGLMIFTTYEFLIFFLIVFTLYWLIKQRAGQNLLLLAASYVFYGWVHPWYVTLLGISTLGDFFLALGIDRQRNRTRLFLTLSVLLNLGVLAFFKYMNFYVDSLAFPIDPVLANIVLPTGLSFYTLKKLAYVIDVSRGVIEPTRDLAGFALFVSFFPQINSGPIDRAQKLLPQIQLKRTWRADNFHAAWPLLVMGFFKKLVIADTVRVAVDRVFMLKTPSMLLVLTASLGFMLQILADFSAYTDLSRAIARLFGFNTSENFRTPYLSLTPTDFWNRWHITLSTWLRDYIFFPLRRRLLRAHTPAWITDALPPLVTMLASGIWHGTGWTYLTWGLFFGVIIVLYQSLGLGGGWEPSNRVTGFLAWLVMFILLVVSFAIFRSPSLGWLGQVVLGGSLIGPVDQALAALITFSIVAFYTLPLLIKTIMDRVLRPTSILFDLYHVIATVAILVYVNVSMPDFIYFQF